MIKHLIIMTLCLSVVGCETTRQHSSTQLVIEDNIFEDFSNARYDVDKKAFVE